MQDLPENHFAVSGASWVNIMIYLFALIFERVLYLFGLSFFHSLWKQDVAYVRLTETTKLENWNIKCQNDCDWTYLNQRYKMSFCDTNGEMLSFWLKTTVYLNY